MPMLLPVSVYVDRKRALVCLNSYRIALIETVGCSEKIEREGETRSRESTSDTRTDKRQATSLKVARVTVAIATLTASSTPAKD